MPEQARQKKMPNLGEAYAVLVSVVPYRNFECNSTASILAARDMAILLNTTYPLWTGSTTVDAAVVVVRFGDFTQFRASLWIDLPHFTHLGETVVYSCLRMLLGW